MMITKFSSNLKEKRHEKANTHTQTYIYEYLVIDVSNPKSGISSIICILWKDGGNIGPNFINVFNYDCRFTYGFIFMEENWNFLVHRVGLKKKFTFGIQGLFNKLVIYTLEVKGYLHP